jgi:hypothetical protein
MRARSRKLEFVSNNSVDQTPVALYVTTTIVLPRPLKRMVVINWGKGFAFLKLVDDLLQFVHAKSALTASAEIFLELPCVSERLHALRYLDELFQFVKKLLRRPVYNFPAALLQLL